MPRNKKAAHAKRVLARAAAKIRIKDEEKNKIESNVVDSQDKTTEIGTTVVKVMVQPPVSVLTNQGLQNLKMNSTALSKLTSGTPSQVAVAPMPTPVVHNSMGCWNRANTERIFAPKNKTAVVTTVEGGTGLGLQLNKSDTKDSSKITSGNVSREALKPTSLGSWSWSRENKGRIRNKTTKVNSANVGTSQGLELKKLDLKPSSTTVTSGVASHEAGDKNGKAIQKSLDQNSKGCWSRESSEKTLAGLDKATQMIAAKVEKSEKKFESKASSTISLGIMLQVTKNKGKNLKENVPVQNPARCCRRDNTERMLPATIKATEVPPVPIMPNQGIAKQITDSKAPSKVNSEKMAEVPQKEFGASQEAEVQENFSKTPVTMDPSANINLKTTSKETMINDKVVTQNHPAQNSITSRSSETIMKFVETNKIPKPQSENMSNQESYVDPTTPVDMTSVESTAAGTILVNTTPVGTTHVDTTPIGTTHVDTTPVGTTHIDTTPAGTTYVDTSLVDTISINTTPVDMASSVTMTPVNTISVDMSEADLENNSSKFSDDDTESNQQTLISAKSSNLFYNAVGLEAKHINLLQVPMDLPGYFAIRYIPDISCCFEPVFNLEAYVAECRIPVVTAFDPSDTAQLPLPVQLSPQPLLQTAAQFSSVTQPITQGIMPPQYQFIPEIQYMFPQEFVPFEYPNPLYQPYYPENNMMNNPVFPPYDVNNNNVAEPPQPQATCSCAFQLATVASLKYTHTEQVNNMLEVKDAIGLLSKAVKKCPTAVIIDDTKKEPLRVVAISEFLKKLDEDKASLQKLLNDVTFSQKYDNFILTRQNEKIERIFYELGKPHTHKEYVLVLQDHGDTKDPVQPYYGDQKQETILGVIERQDVFNQFQQFIEGPVPNFCQCEARFTQVPIPGPSRPRRHKPHSTYRH